MSWLRSVPLTGTTGLRRRRRRGRGWQHRISSLLLALGAVNTLRLWSWHAQELSSVARAATDRPLDPRPPRPSRATAEEEASPARATADAAAAAAPAEEAPANEAPTEEAPAKEAPAKVAPAEGAGSEGRGVAGASAGPAKGADAPPPPRHLVSSPSSVATAEVPEPRRPCHIVVENKADYHYEVIESAIMQYPLPWDTFNCSKEVAVFDVALAESHVWTKHEKEPWKSYFRNHLAGTVRPRTIGDGAVVHFGTIVSYTNYTRTYDAIIGVSCDTLSVPRRHLANDPRLFCILHANPPEKIESRQIPEEFHNRTCWVNPMHDRCYFIPSDLPTFPKPKLVRNGTIRICAKTKVPRSSLYFLRYAMQKLEYPTNVEILLMGGHGIYSTVAFFHKASYVTEVNEPDYYEFVRKMSQCHVLVPLIHPWDNPNYFPLPDSEKKLSGYVSQAIGLKLPLLVHEDLHDIYKAHLTAPVWTYSSANMTDWDPFADVFGRVLAEVPAVLEAN